MDDAQQLDMAIIEALSRVILFISPKTSNSRPFSFRNASIRMYMRHSAVSHGASNQEHSPGSSPSSRQTDSGNLWFLVISYRNALSDSITRCRLLSSQLDLYNASIALQMMLCFNPNYWHSCAYRKVGKRARS